MYPHFRKMLRPSYVVALLFTMSSFPPAVISEDTRSGVVQSGESGGITVDLYQNCESGNDGDVLSSTIMNASSHGVGSWSTSGGRMWVSTKRVKRLPGTITVDGVTYTDIGTRTWVGNDNLAMNRVRLNIDVPGGEKHTNVTLGAHITIGPQVFVYNNFDNIYMEDGFTYAVLQVIYPGHGPYVRGHSLDDKGKTTTSRRIKVESGKTYWVNLGFRGKTHECLVAVFDSSTWEQVGETVSCYVRGSKIGLVGVYFGRADNHGNNPNARTQTYFDNIVLDYTDPPFPLLPAFDSPPQGDRGRLLTPDR